MFAEGPLTGLAEQSAGWLDGPLQSLVLLDVDGPVQNLHLYFKFKIGVKQV